MKKQHKVPKLGDSEEENKLSEHRQIELDLWVAVQQGDLNRYITAGQKYDQFDIRNITDLAERHEFVSISFLVGNTLRPQNHYSLSAEIKDYADANKDNQNADADKRNVLISALKLTYSYRSRNQIKLIDQDTLIKLAQKGEYEILNQELNICSPSRADLNLLLRHATTSESPDRLKTVKTLLRFGANYQAKSKNHGPKSIRELATPGSDVDQFYQSMDNAKKIGYGSGGLVAAGILVGGAFGMKALYELVDAPSSKLPDAAKIYITVMVGLFAILSAGVLALGTYASAEQIAKPSLDVNKPFVVANQTGVSKEN